MVPVVLIIDLIAIFVAGVKLLRLQEPAGSHKHKHLWLTLFLLGLVGMAASASDLVYSVEPIQLWAPFCGCAFVAMSLLSCLAVVSYYQELAHLRDFCPRPPEPGLQVYTDREGERRSA